MDRLIQRRLIVALVLLETGLVAACLLFLYWDLMSIIEQDMFRIHAASMSNSNLLFLQNMAQVIAAFMAVNVAVLAAGEWIWNRYVASVLRDFTTLVDKTADLDFTSDSDLAVRHEVLDRFSAWRSNERRRLIRVREITERLNPGADLSDPGNRAALCLVLMRTTLALRSKSETENAIQFSASQ